VFERRPEAALGKSLTGVSRQLEVVSAGFS